MRPGRWGRFTGTVCPVGAPQHPGRSGVVAALCWWAAGCPWRRVAVALSAPPPGTMVEGMHADGGTDKGHAVPPEPAREEAAGEEPAGEEPAGEELLAVAARLEAEAAAAVASLRRQAALLHARAPAARPMRRPPEAG